MKETMMDADADQSPHMTAIVTTPRVKTFVGGRTEGIDGVRRHLADLHGDHWTGVAAWPRRGGVVARSSETTLSMKDGDASIGTERLVLTWRRGRRRIALLDMPMRHDTHRPDPDSASVMAWVRSIANTAAMVISRSAIDGYGGMDEQRLWDLVESHIELAGTVAASEGAPQALNASLPSPWTDTTLVDGSMTAIEGISQRGAAMLASNWSEGPYMAYVVGKAPADGILFDVSMNPVVCEIRVPTGIDAMRSIAKSAE